MTYCFCNMCGSLTRVFSIDILMDKNGTEYTVCKACNVNIIVIGVLK